MLSLSLPLPVAVPTVPSPREAVGRVERLSKAMAVGVGGFSLSAQGAPHPRPLPTTRYARGGRGVALRQGANLEVS
jgi:hypothetical protein